MSVTQSDLTAFQQFALSRIGAGSADTSLEELAYDWQISRERDSANLAIREGLTEVRAEQHRPARDASEELARKHGLSSE